MPKKLKVYGGCLSGRGREIVATTSIKAASDLFGVSLSYCRNYVMETSNEKEIKTAMSKPGTVFFCKKALLPGAKWKEIDKSA